MYLNKIKFFENIIFVILISLLLTNFAKADLIKPNSGIEPIQVVKIQLRGLKNNDQLYQDGGIEQTWEFAHPKNRKFTGPLTKFKSMIKGDDFSMLLNHKEHKVKEVFLSDDVATFEVIVLNSDKEYFKFKWQVEKFKKEGTLKNCWLTTAVSSPISIGSSI
ncbi:MAG: hypothetical protein EVA74_00305 [Candidatus Pelagibacterales bacterium]|jgi:hypothetical protein|nr:hypothetical protein [Candidatus Pelagibacter sp.]RZO51328.1 MAG: hypothetical protein EVA74_00305 [Pelagibacterales bacterium]|tara:strand:+ start:166 stop:651 length:486 start_codon:yes stop_codon:yes gene_type:complete